MRLSEVYRSSIKRSFAEVFGEGHIYLFGSRVDDDARGGDIDLYLDTKEIENLFQKKIQFLAKIKREIGEQKIDVVFHINKERLIEQEARRWGVEL
jgi:predicted nucleotidyltransferase